MHSKVNTVLFHITAAVVLLLTVGCNAPDPHAGHDHGSHETVKEHEDHDEHAGHDHASEDEHAEQDDHDGHEEHESTVELDDAGKKFAGIGIGTVEKMQLGKYITLPGEVTFNEDRQTLVIPRYPGIVREVKVGQGDYVKQGDVLAVIEADETFAVFEVTAPMDGRIIEKDIVAGARAEEGAAIYQVADLATVWVHLDVYPDDLGWVRTGLPVRISAVGGDGETEGRISYISPALRQETRNARARVVIGSQRGTWRPGMFVKGTITIRSDKPVTAVRSTAVQVLEGEKVVFVPAGDHGYTTVPVVPGRSNGTYTEIRSGLRPGDVYVIAGAFELKAKIVTGSLDPHAGHGH